jgi:hypothetical protein
VVLRYRLGDEVNQTTTPLLITEPEDEQFWPGQSQALHDLLPGPREQDLLAVGGDVLDRPGAVVSIRARLVRIAGERIIGSREVGTWAGSPCSPA